MKRFYHEVDSLIQLSLVCESLVPAAATVFHHHCHLLSVVECCCIVKLVNVAECLSEFSLLACECQNVEMRVWMGFHASSVDAFRKFIEFLQI